MCSCGCNTCETKIRGPLLTEGKVKSLLSEGLQYHIDKKIPLFETVYRIGSDKYLALIKEARKMYSRNVIDLCEEDEALIKTHLGEFGIYEGESVPLDLPMLNEEIDGLENAKKLLSKKPYKILDIEYKKTWSRGDKFIKITYEQLYTPGEMYWSEPQFVSVFYDTDEELERIKKELKLSSSNINESELEEAEFKGKDVPLNKPKRGGSKAYYVYVRDPKTKKIKKVSFGSGGLRAKIKNKEARNAFAARHNCKDKKDRTKAGYWSCNLPKFAKLLGLGANQNTYW